MRRTIGPKRVNDHAAFVKKRQSDPAETHDSHARQRAFPGSRPSATRRSGRGRDRAERTRDVLGHLARSPRRVSHVDARQRRHEHERREVRADR